AKFASRGKFLAFCEGNVKNSYGDEIGLNYIKNLGVTHIQLMPIFDFDSDGSEYNWGYNPRFYNAPSNCYSLNNAVLELRELILQAHQKGLGVIADVVYNHVFSAENSCFEKQVPGYFFRGDGEFSNGSGCGNEFASERFMARKFILDSLEFLIKEYHIDGFRFDIMGLLDVQTMRKIERNLRKINPAVLLYGEGWTGGASPLPERLRAVQRNAKKLPEIAFFNDSFRDAVKGNVFDKMDCGFVNGKPDFAHFLPVFSSISGKFSEEFWTKNPAQTINYVECHDNLTLFDKLKISLNNAGSERIVSAEKMSATLIFLSCGIAFFQAGQEFLRSKNFSENSYNLPDKTNSIKWNLLRKNREIVEYYRGLIAFRKRFYGVFRDCCYEQIDGNFLLKKGNFYMLINTSNSSFEPKIQGYFEYFIDENCASDKPLYTKKRLCSADFGVVVARRIDDEK
ncbi:MAG: alpha-amylase family glycosyl hydrolase, partial [Oscillospiraceae bacterium]